MNNFLNSNIALIIASFYRTSPQEFNIIFKSGIFSLGIIWNSLKQIIIIAGISFVFGVGLKGSGLQVDYLFLNLLLWFLFAEITNTSIAMQPNDAILSQNNVNTFNYFIGHISRIIIQYFILLGISFFIFTIFDLKIYYFDTIKAFILMALIAIIYSIPMSSILHRKTFLIEIHGFSMQALFFASSAVIPITIIPNPIRDFLLFNPMVHVQELIKSNVTGIELTYISINYVWLFILLGSFLILPSLYYKNKRFKEQLGHE